MMTDQMALALPHEPPRPGVFLAAASNAAARRWLDHMHDWPDRRLVLWGERGCGKTHLARGWAAGGLYTHAAVPDHLGTMPARIAIDAADACADHAALLHLLNACAEARTHVLLTAGTPPARWPVRLPDLASRLRAMQTARIDPPEDALLRSLLASALAERQLVMPLPVRDWLLSRLPRTAHDVIAAVAMLDRASLARQRPLTIPLAAAALPHLHPAPADCASPPAGVM